MYRLIFRLLIEPLDAEWTHRLGLGILRLITDPSWIRRRLRRLTAPPDPRLEVQALGRTFPSPLGVAAGVDKEGQAFRGLWALGFGFVEVGTITPEAQRGNAGKRIARVPVDRAIVNRMGFPNPGAAAAVQRLRRAADPILVGMNIGKSRETPVTEAAVDYARAARALAPVADYLVINISSPNTPGLREMQAADLLRPLVAEVRDALHAVNSHPPLLVKIAPDLSDEELDAIVDVAAELRLDGIVAVNSTVDRSGLTRTSNRSGLTRTSNRSGLTRAPDLFPDGGVSGAPLKSRSLHVLRRLRARAGERLTLISVGGIEDAEDVWERIAAGASLVQAYTGFVYGGPAWPRRINRTLSRRLREAGHSSIQELIGASSPPLPSADSLVAAHEDS